jgi:hypothetical protein
MAHLASKSRCWTWQLFVYISLFFTIQVPKEPKKFVARKSPACLKAVLAMTTQAFLAMK